MKYVIKKERLSLPGAMTYLYEGYFIRRSCWSHGVVFTKVDYWRTEIGGIVCSEYEDIEALLNKNPALVPQFWYTIGAVRYKGTPDDVLARDWQVVQCISMTPNEEKRMEGKIGGIKFTEL